MTTITANPKSSQKYSKEQAGPCVAGRSFHSTMFINISLIVRPQEHREFDLQQIRAIHPACVKAN